MIRFFTNYWLSILINLIILTLCLIDTSQIEAPPMTNFDKLVHLLMFMGISGVIFFDNTSYLRKRISSQRIILGSFLFPVIFGGIIEILQAYLTTSRSGDWMDFLFDTIGSFFGILICLVINRMLKITSSVR
jgi:VanZ family protein